MKTIYKYVIPFSCYTLLTAMPRDAQILSVQVQHDKDICIWALVETDALNDNNPPMQVRRFEAVRTGSEMPDGWDTATYLGTVQLCEGRLVWHVFEYADVMGRRA